MNQRGPLTADVCVSMLGFKSSPLKAVKDRGILTFCLLTATSLTTPTTRHTKQIRSLCRHSFLWPLSHSVFGLKPIYTKKKNIDLTKSLLLYYYILFFNIEHLLILMWEWSRCGSKAVCFYSSCTGIHVLPAMIHLSTTCSQIQPLLKHYRCVNACMLVSSSICLPICLHWGRLEAHPILHNLY